MNSSPLNTSFKMYSRIVSAFFKFLIVIALGCGASRAGADSGEASSFLLSVVSSDFRGDPEPRFERVTYSSKAEMLEYERKRKLDGPVPEIYFVDTDPIVVVASWKQIAFRIDDDGKHCLVVQFETLARSVGQGAPSWEHPDVGRMLIAYPNHTTEIVSYCSIELRGKWVLVDPPLPRIQKNVVVEVIEHEIETAENLMKRIKTADSRAITNLEAIRDSFVRQLAVLRLP